MYRHGIISEFDPPFHCGRRRCAGAAAGSCQHDAGRIAGPVAETDAVAGIAAVRCDCHHHARGLDDGPLKETKEWSSSIESIPGPVTTARRRWAAANAARNTTCASPPMEPSTRPTRRSAWWPWLWAV